MRYIPLRLKPHPFPTLLANSPFGCDITPSPPKENRDGPDAEFMTICASPTEAHAKMEAVLSTDTAFNHILSPSGFEPALVGPAAPLRANAISFYGNGL